MPDAGPVAGFWAQPVKMPLPAMAQIESNMTHSEYLSVVERAKEYIRAGDVFQVVPSQRFRREFKPPPFALYRALRRLKDLWQQSQGAAP